MAELKNEVISHNQDIERFTRQARSVAAVVHEVADMEQAISYAVDLSDKRTACRLNVSGHEGCISSDSRYRDNDKSFKIIAAPAITTDDYNLLQKGCREKGIACISSDLRAHLDGVDVGLTYGDWGISETGTVVLDCANEDLRLATMISEFHICVLPKRRIVKDSFTLTRQLQHSTHNTPNYTAFVTGPSRTADIERVLAIGVHGPLELHILLLED